MSKEREDRAHLVIDTIGLEILQRDPVISAVFHQHVQREDFSLHLCLADMVKMQTETKNRAQKVAAEALQYLPPMQMRKP